MPRHGREFAVQLVDVFQELSGVSVDQFGGPVSGQAETSRLESMPNAVPSTQFSCALKMS